MVSAGRNNEITDRGIALVSGKQIDGKSWGYVSQDVTGFEGGTDKWRRTRATFRDEGLVQDREDRCLSSQRRD